MKKYENMGSIIFPHVFNDLTDCNGNMSICLCGLCCPTCLFGIIYQKIQLGSCLTGFCKYFALQFLISATFTSMIYTIEWDMLYSKEYYYENTIRLCYNNNNCTDNFDDKQLYDKQLYDKQLYDKQLYDNKCIIKNTTAICDCIKEPLIEQCEFNMNELPGIMDNLFGDIIFISILNLLVMCMTTGLYLGQIRNKMGQKYNILYNSRYNFLVHCNPITNQCALCQEYNTINRIDDIITPLYTVQSPKTFY